eukprot:4282787-Prymnesium_polylepis.1
MRSALRFALLSCGIALTLLLLLPSAPRSCGCAGSPLLRTRCDGDATVRRRESGESRQGDANRTHATGGGAHGIRAMSCRARKAVTPPTTTNPGGGGADCRTKRSHRAGLQAVFIHFRTGDKRHSTPSFLFKAWSVACPPFPLRLSLCRVCWVCPRWPFLF